MKIDEKAIERFQLLAKQVNVVSRSKISVKIMLIERNIGESNVSASRCRDRLPENIERKDKRKEKTNCDGSHNFVCQDRIGCEACLFCPLGLVAVSYFSAVKYIEITDGPIRRPPISVSRKSHSNTPVRFDLMTAPSLSWI
jgi:hypothetical protein